MVEVELIEARWRGSSKRWSDSGMFEIEILDMLPIVIGIDQV